MKRRSFFKSVAMAGLAASTTVKESSAYLVAHNWDKYDFGSGPPVKDRLKRGRFRSILRKRTFRAAMS